MTHYHCAHCEAREPHDATHNGKNYLTIAQGSFNPATPCSHCGAAGMACAHNDPDFDEERQEFVCGDCQQECGFTTLPLML